MTSPVLTRDAIKEADDRAIEPVEVPEWGGMLYVRALSGVERDAFELEMLVQKKDKRGRVLSSDVNLKNLRARLVVRTAVDSDDPNTAKPIFTPEDEKWLGTKSASALQRVYEVAQRLSRLSNEDVEELTKELGEETNGDSGSDSPSLSVFPTSMTSSSGSPQPSTLSGEPTTTSNPSADDDSTYSSPI